MSVQFRVIQGLIAAAPEPLVKACTKTQLSCVAAACANLVIALLGISTGNPVLLIAGLGCAILAGEGSLIAQNIVDLTQIETSNRAIIAMGITQQEFVSTLLRDTFALKAALSSMLLRVLQ